MEKFINFVFYLNFYAWWEIFLNMKYRFYLLSLRVTFLVFALNVAKKLFLNFFDNWNCSQKNYFQPKMPTFRMFILIFTLRFDLNWINSVFNCKIFFMLDKKKGKESFFQTFFVYNSHCSSKVDTSPNNINFFFSLIESCKKFPFIKYQFLSIALIKTKYMYTFDFACSVVGV